MVVCENIKVPAGILDNRMQAFVDWQTSIFDLPQNCVQYYYISDCRIFQNINLKYYQY